jgi:hypothetical protein
MTKKPAKSTSSFSLKYKEKAKISRPSVHAKTKTSNHKKSKNYVKKSRGQG